jgi:peptidoglycan/xylan/chitin deacetylase (PgdA/CDA1 family)
MGKRFDALLFPGRKHKAFTLSYDDGVVQDRRLIELFDRYEAKATFNLGYGHLGFQGAKSYHGRTPVDVSKVTVEEVKELYRNHEVGGHSLDHPDLTGIGTPYVMHEVIEDKIRLEELIEKPLEVFAYPYGTFNEDVKKIVSLAGYKGARTTRSTHRFDLPLDPYEWDPTCHHNDEKLMDLAKEFVEKEGFRTSLFYVWGHGYEFDDRDNWKVMEDLLNYLDQYREQIWFASNGEILRYLEAYHRLEYSGDGTMVFNPSSIDLDIYTYENTYEHLPAGCLTKIRETGLL